MSKHLDSLINAQLAAAYLEVWELRHKVEQAEASVSYHLRPESNDQESADRRLAYIRTECDTAINSLDRHLRIFIVYKIS